MPDPSPTNHHPKAKPPQKTKTNAKLVALSLTKMQVTSTHSVGRSPDVLAFDRDRRRLYVAAESGVVSIFQQQGETLVKLEDVFVDNKANLSPD